MGSWLCTVRLGIPHLCRGWFLVVCWMAPGVSSLLPFLKYYHWSLKKKKNNKKPAFMSLSSLESQWGISQRTRKDLKHSGVEGWRFQSCLSLQDTLLRLILPLVCLPVRGAAEQSWSVTVPLLTECPLGSSHLSLWTRDSKWGCEPVRESWKLFQETFQVKIVFIIRCSLPFFFFCYVGFCTDKAGKNAGASVQIKSPNLRIIYCIRHHQLLNMKKTKQNSSFI